MLSLSLDVVIELWGWRLGIDSALANQGWGFKLAYGTKSYSPDTALTTPAYAKSFTFLCLGM